MRRCSESAGGRSPTVSPPSQHSAASTYVLSRTSPRWSPNDSHSANRLYPPHHGPSPRHGPPPRRPLPLPHPPAVMSAVLAATAAATAASAPSDARSSALASTFRRRSSSSPRMASWTGRRAARMAMRAVSPARATVCTRRGRASQRQKGPASTWARAETQRAGSKAQPPQQTDRGGPHGVSVSKVTPNPESAQPSGRRCLSVRRANAHLSPLPRRRPPSQALGQQTTRGSPRPATCPPPLPPPRAPPGPRTLTISARVAADARGTRTVSPPPPAGAGLSPSPAPRMALSTAPTSDGSWTPTRRPPSRTATVARSAKGATPPYAGTRTSGDREKRGGQVQREQVKQDGEPKQDSSGGVPQGAPRRGWGWRRAAESVSDHRGDVRRVGARGVGPSMTTPPHAGKGAERGRGTPGNGEAPPTPSISPTNITGHSRAVARRPPQTLRQLR